MKAALPHRHIYAKLNGCAERFNAAPSLTEKRQALRNYLMELRLLAIYADTAPKAEDEVIYNPNYGPLDELIECLHRIDNEEFPELLTPPPKNGAPPTPRGAQWQWARASALITVLMKKFDKDEDEAARITVRALKELGRSPPGRGRNPKKSLNDWRDKLMAGKKGKRAKEWYDLALLAPSYPWWKVTEGAAIQIFLNPQLIDYELKFTF